MSREALFKQGEKFFAKQQVRCETKTVCIISLVTSAGETFVFVGVNKPKGKECCRLREQPSNVYPCEESQHAEQMAVQKINSFLAKGPRKIKYLSCRITRPPCKECVHSLTKLLGMLGSPRFDIRWENR